MIKALSKRIKRLCSNLKPTILVHSRHVLAQMLVTAWVRADIMVKMQQNDMHVKSFSGMAGMVCCSFMGSKTQQAPMLTPSKQGMIIVGMAAFKRTEARGFVGIMQVF